MELKNEIIVIKHLAKNVVNSLLDIGLRLKKLRDTGAFKEKYNTFTDMLKNEDLGFQYSESFISKLLSLVEDQKLVSLAKKIGVTKTIELLYVPNRDKREEIAEKAVKEGLSFREIRQEVTKAKITPEKPPLLDTSDERYRKLLREYDTFGAEIRRLIEEIEDLHSSYLIWDEKSLKYKELDTNRDDLKSLWDGLRLKLEELK